MSNKQTVGDKIKELLPEAVIHTEGKCTGVEVNGVNQMIVSTEFWNSEWKGEQK